VRIPEKKRDIRGGRNPGARVDKGRVRKNSTNASNNHHRRQGKGNLTDSLIQVATKKEKGGITAKSTLKGGAQSMSVGGTENWGGKTKKRAKVGYVTGSRRVRELLKRKVRGKVTSYYRMKRGKGRETKADLVGRAVVERRHSWHANKKKKVPILSSLPDDPEGSGDEKDSKISQGRAHVNLWGSWGKKTGGTSSLWQSGLMGRGPFEKEGGEGTWWGGTTVRLI